MCCLLTQGLVCCVCLQQLPGSGKTWCHVRSGNRTIVRSTKRPDWLESTWLSTSWLRFLHLLKFPHCSSDVLIGKMSLHFSFWGILRGWKHGMGCSSCVPDCPSGVCSCSFRQGPAHGSLRPPSHLITGKEVSTGSVCWLDWALKLWSSEALKSPVMPVSGRTC